MTRSHLDDAADLIFKAIETATADARHDARLLPILVEMNRALDALALLSAREPAFMLRERVAQPELALVGTDDGKAEDPRRLTAFDLAAIGDEIATESLSWVREPEQPVARTRSDQPLTVRQKLVQTLQGFGLSTAPIPFAYQWVATVNSW